MSIEGEPSGNAKRSSGGRHHESGFASESAIHRQVAHVRGNVEGQGRNQLRKDILARGEEHTGTTGLAPHVLVAGACLGTVVVSRIELLAIDQQFAVE